jgi:hypothetical protein
MIFLVLGVLGVWIALSASRGFSRADPRRLARLLKRTGGLFCLGSAVSLLLLGRVGAAILLASFGFWLIGWSGLAIPSSMLGAWGSVFGQRRSKSFRSDWIDLVSDEQTGMLRGSVHGGPQAGRQLDDLAWPECEALYKLCGRHDPQGARLLEAYLDRRFPGWRHADQGHSNAGGRRDDNRNGGSMSEDLAYQVLGLQKGAPREAIVRAHRSLMQKLHPDHGGSTDLAARVNEAKDVLLRHH